MTNDERSPNAQMTKGALEHGFRYSLFVIPRRMAAERGFLIVLRFPGLVLSRDGSVRLAKKQKQK